jgi:hypothetical protein
MQAPKEAYDEMDAGQGNFSSSPLTVRLLDPLHRSPATPIEKLAVATLKEREPTPLTTLVERVAHGVYLDEIRAGAWVLDIGLFGSRLFTRDVARELEAADGILWKITQHKEPVQ